MKNCDLCGLPLGEETVRTDHHEFCCPGCHEIHRTLGAESLGAVASDGADTILQEGDERVYFQVPQMRCASCEAFLTSRTRTLEGVSDARANYAAEMVMVDYDPDAVSESEIARSLDTGSYTPRRPSEETSEASRELGRLLVGGFFGMMVMLWYVLFIYPTYLGVSPENLLLDLSGGAGRYLFFNLLIMSGAVVFYTGWPILRGAWVGLRSTYPNMDLLIALAVLNAFFFSLFVLFQGGQEVYFDISVVVILVVTFGRYFENRLKETALRKVRKLSEDSVSSVRVQNESGPEEVDPEELETGDDVLVKSGEEIPVDGRIQEGRGHVDESLVTGESRPVRKDPGDDVLAGSLLREGSITVGLTGDPEESFVDLLRDRMWELQSSQFNVQKVADKLAGVFVPMVLFLALGTFATHLVLGSPFDQALLSGMTLLVVSCPCALGLATPMATMTAFEALLDRGVAPRSAGAFDRDEQVNTIVFDKTGTITEDRLSVSTNEASEEGIRKAASVESRAHHPLARTIESLVDRPQEVEDFREYTGKGVAGTINDERVYVGNRDLFDHHELAVPESLFDRYERARRDGGIPVLIGWDDQARDLLVLEEHLRRELDDLLDDAAKRDLDVVVMTGDDREGIERMIDHPALREVYTEVKPEAKVKLIESLRRDGSVLMVGDGKNDAPALAAADLGIAVGNRTALASNAADLIFVNDTLEPLAQTLEILRRTNRRIRQNLGWAFLYNGVAIPAALLGYLNPLLAAVAMALSSLMVVMNSRRG